MLFAVVVLLCALLLGVLSGGRLGNLGHLSLRHGWLVVAALAVQLAGGILGGASYPAGLASSVLLLGAFLLHNRFVPGIWLVALGLLGNALVVGLNGAMPVSLHASGRAGVSVQELLTGTDPRHELADDYTRLRPLGDVIPVLLPGRPEVVSPGDVLVVSGLAQLVFVGVRLRTPLARSRD